MFVSSYTGDMIRKIRLEKNLTQKQLGDLCGIADSNIRKYESGKQNPKIETLEKIANALNVPISSLRPLDSSIEAFLKQNNPLAMDIFSLFTGQPPKIAERGWDVLEQLQESTIKSAELAVFQGKELLNSINKLNEEGQQKVKDYADDLAENPKYRKTDTPGTEE